MNDGEKRRARAETAGCSGERIHFNNAGAALPPTVVTDRCVEHIRLEGEIGAYEAHARCTEEVERVYDEVALLLHCKSSEIALTCSATRAWDMAFHSIPFRAGTRILTSTTSYGSNYLAMLHVSRTYDVEIEVLENDADGVVSVQALRSTLSDPGKKRVSVVCITHCPTNSGVVMPAERIGAVTREFNVLYLLDACQSIGQRVVDVQQIGCDMASGTSRKYLRGPRGVGFLYVRESALEFLTPPFIDIRAATWTSESEFEWAAGARRFETWEKNVAAVLAFGAAVRYANAFGIEVIQMEIERLATALREKLVAVDGVKVLDRGRERSGIVTFNKRGMPAWHMQRWLLTRRINTSVSARSSTLLDMDERDLDAVVRASVHCYNSDEEIEALVKAVAEAQSSTDTTHSE